MLVLSNVLVSRNLYNIKYIEIYSPLFKVDRIGGGMIGGTLENVQKWSKMYYITLKR